MASTLSLPLISHTFPLPRCTPAPYLTLICSGQPNKLLLFLQAQFNCFSAAYPSTSPPPGTVVSSWCFWSILHITSPLNQPSSRHSCFLIAFLKYITYHLTAIYLSFSFLCRLKLCRQGLTWSFVSSTSSEPGTLNFQTEQVGGFFRYRFSEVHFFSHFSFLCFSNLLNGVTTK